MKQILSIIPTLNKVGGHEYGYHLSFAEAVFSNGWAHRALIPKKVHLPGQPPLWQAILPACKKSRWLPKPFRAIQDTLSMTKALFSGLKTPTDVVFYERFSHIDLLSLFFVLMLTRKKPEIWLFYRVVPEYFKRHQEKHFILFKKLSQLVCVKLMTDTDLLQSSLRGFFRQEVYLLPIPHTQTKGGRGCVNAQCLMWWPGGMREEKGLRHIVNMARGKDEGLKLVVVEEMKPYLEKCRLDVIWVASDMPRKEFEEWMHRADVILLPYISNIHYKYSSSGLFVEAIVAGKVVLGSTDTWVAHELEKYGLSELVIDWEREGVLEIVKRLFRDASVRAKLEVMREDYKAFHCQEHFVRDLYCFHLNLFGKNRARAWNKIGEIGT